MGYGAGMLKQMIANINHSLGLGQHAKLWLMEIEIECFQTPPCRHAGVQFIVITLKNGLT